MASWVVAQRSGPTAESMNVYQVCQRGPLPGGSRREKHQQDYGAYPDWSSSLGFTLPAFLRHPVKSNAALTQIEEGKEKGETKSLYANLG
jgi:hypothetical protein